MSKYEYIGRKDLITLSIGNIPYIVDLSKIDYSFVDIERLRTKKVRDMEERIDRGERPPEAEMRSFYNSIDDSVKAIIEKILPGQWDELFKASGNDMAEMVRLGNYIFKELDAAGAKVCRFD